MATLTPAGGAPALVNDRIQAHDTRLDSVETSVAGLIAATGDTAFGKSTIGGVAAAIGSNVKMVNVFTVPADGEIPYLDIYLDGNGGNVTGTQVMKGVIFNDLSSNPNAKIAESVQVSITPGQAASWVRFTFNTPLSVSAGDVIWMGYHAGTSGSIARYYFDGGGGQRFNTDLYSDGVATPFGTATVVGQTLSVKTVVQNNTPAQIAALQDDVDALTAADTALDDRIQVLESGGAAGAGAGVSTQLVANFPFPANAVIESDPQVGGGVMVLAGAAGDQSITSVQVVDSMDGTTWRAHVGSSTVVYRPVWKARLTNGGTLQGTSEFSVAYS